MEEPLEHLNSEPTAAPAATETAVDAATTENSVTVANWQNEPKQEAKEEPEEKEPKVASISQLVAEEGELERQDSNELSPRKREASEINEPEAKKPRTIAVDDSELAGGALRRSGRERKAVHREGFVSEEEATEQSSTAAGDEVEKGRGRCLKDIPAFVENYENLKSSSAAPRKLFKALFKVAGRPADRKDQILEWSGLPEGKPVDSLMNDIAKACTLPDLREIGRKLMGQSAGIGNKDTKQAWIESITSFLSNPQEEAVAVAVIESISRGAGRGGVSAFQMFSAEFRATVQAENPDAPNRDIMRLLGEKWRGLSEAEKQKYQNATSAKNGNTFGGRRKSNLRGRKSRKQDSSEEDDPPLEEDEDEDDEEMATGETDAL